MRRIVTACVAAIGFTLAVPQIAYAAPADHSSASYTMAQVATHNTAGDCWSAVGRGVYNLTTWLPTHTTATITAATVCGVNSSALFGVPATSGRHDDNDDDNGTDDHRGGRAKAAVVRAHHSDHRVRDHGRGNGRGRGHNALLRSIAPFKIGHLVATTPVPAPAPVPAPTTTYTLTQVQAHSAATDCWTIISGKVYNLTSFVNSHKGGQAAITGLCGKDGTTAFTTQHGGQGNPASVLAGLQVGVLA